MSLCVSVLEKRQSHPQQPHAHQYRPDKLVGRKRHCVVQRGGNAKQKRRKLGHHILQTNHPAHGKRKGGAGAQGMSVQRFNRAHTNIHTHTLTHRHSLTLTHPLINRHSLTHSLTHSQTDTHTHSLTLTHSLALSPRIREHPGLSCRGH